MSFKYIKDIDVVILCGGRGRRLRCIVKNLPKPMVLIKNRTFLDILIDYVLKFGFKKIILCTGYKSNFIKKYYQKKGFNIIFSEEKEPLGTGGALKNAKAFIKSPLFLVMNGDSFFKINLRRFINFHISKKAAISIAVKKAGNESGYGVIRLDSFSRIISFNEKINIVPNCYINAGIYCFQKNKLSLLPRKRKFSLEKDFLNTVVIKHKVYGYKSCAAFIDIGTPERYKEAENFFEKFMDRNGKSEQ